MFPYEFAMSIADEFLGQIAPFCQRIEIVGSLRRLRRDVHDIDILAIPCVINIPDKGLFGNPKRQNLLELKLGNLCRKNWFAIDPDGPKHKRLLREEQGETLPVDLYIATEETWWTQLLIRTGSRVHNIKLAQRAQQLDMKLKADGGGLISADGTPIPIRSEEEIFDHLRLPYKPPNERE
jgi:DNA polymerase/3'-5' exonuclease PolX